MSTVRQYRNPQLSPREHALVMLAVFIALFIAAASVVSCSPRIVENVRTEYRNSTDIQHDTVWSERERYVFQQGDTVRIYQTETVYNTRVLVQRDTVTLHDTTRVYMPPKEVEIEKPLTASQTLKIRAFWGLLAGLAVCLAYIFRKPLLALIRRRIA